MQSFSESLNSALSFKKVKDNASGHDRYLKYEFSSAGATLYNGHFYEVWIDIADIDSAYPMLIEVMFDMKGNEGMRLTNTGNAFQVFATIKQILKDVMSMYPNEDWYRIRFTAEENEPSRLKPYTRFAAEIAKALGGQWHTTSTGRGRQEWVIEVNK